MAKVKHEMGLHFIAKKRLTRYGYRTMHSWVIYGRNGKMVDSSDEDFYNYDDCVENAKATRDYLIEGLNKLT